LAPYVAELRGANEQWFSNRAETRGFYSVLFEVQRGLQRTGFLYARDASTRGKRSWQTERRGQDRFIQWMRQMFPHEKTKGVCREFQNEEAEQEWRMCHKVLA